MSFKNFKVYFTRTAVGELGEPLARSFANLLPEHGRNLPAIDVSNERFQIRDLEQVGTVWKGTFVKLRDDAPHIVAADDRELELDLDDGDHIIEKCHFLLRERGNVLVWQANRSAGGLSRAQDYLSRLLADHVVLAHVMNDAELDRVMAGQLYEVDFAYDRPPVLAGNSPRWNQDAFDMMARVDAAHAKFTLRAPRRGGLAEGAKNMVRQLMQVPGTAKVRVRLTDESEPIEMFMAPLKDTIRLQLFGRYPIKAEVFAELEDAFARNRREIPRLPD